jgi:GNAT superfamily N-acetyltransferase
MAFHNDVVDQLDVTAEDQPDAHTIARLKASLETFNVSQVGPGHAQPFAVVSRDRAGNIQAGILGQSYWAWLFIEVLWISEACRGGGLGSRLLHEAELVALRRGCAGVWLSTMSFQAPSFYKRHGYVEFGRLEGMPPGHARVWLAKALTQATPEERT